MNTEEYVRAKICGLSGSDWENAYHSLLEIREPCMRWVMAAYVICQDLRVREMLLQIAGCRDELESYGLLEEALRSGQDSLWKTALDSLVSLKTPTAEGLILRELALESGAKKSWLQEALTQMEQS